MQIGPFSGTAKFGAIVSTKYANVKWHIIFKKSIEKKKSMTFTGGDGIIGLAYTALSSFNSDTVREIDDLNLFN